MALLIANAVRPRLRLEQESWMAPGKVRLPDVRAARLIAWRVSELLDSTGRSATGVSAGTIRALDVMEEALHRIAKRHLETDDPTLLSRTLERLTKTLDSRAVDRILRAFADEYLGADKLPEEDILLELVLLWVLHINPAAKTVHSVLHDSPLLEQDDFQRALVQLPEVLALEESEEGPAGQHLLDLLLAPQRASPDSLLGQLQFLMHRWGDLLGDYRGELQSGLDLFAEELAPRFGGGPAPSQAPALSLGEDEPVRYSSDRNWMPSLVLVAKNIYVWLDQMSRRSGEPLRHLDQVPDSELARLSAHGITGLWLIGVWERSVASQRVKQMCGNPEAVASAYSLRRYKIADELGGEVAFQRLKQRAWEHGIRLAADMVPNHMGIDSDWVLTRPEWFLGDSRSPFPSYSFDGPDFSPDPAVGIYLEDHYFDRSDAAVVFKRVDHGSGEARFIYHGNDGTSMPWNDTAQLDYLNPQVREAVIETILDVARRFPVIRFDAAMTLAKRHYQRLWFPEPGTAGAIPSRSDYSMTKDEFHRQMPEEFWREVVDRVSSELPDTLLLAEAFWLMEGYFVRTLGMHRVYNSAFMNMLRDQENDKYRRLIKETLEFDPQILQRYVNFMSNPDEETAVEQFGKDDRYFGVCVMMATLPGLPMFAHGQFEGFAEKYGMEYRRAYWNEEVDLALVERHEREIVPLLKRRPLFAGIEHFRLYDLVDHSGVVNEDVYAYSNGFGADRVLVVFNNRYQHARGRVRVSAPMTRGDHGAGKGNLETQTLADALELEATNGSFITFRDLTGGLEYLVDSRELVETGLEIDLGAFHYRVLAGFRALQDTDAGLYRRLADRLGCAGVPSLEQARRGIELEPLREVWNQQVQPAFLDVRSRLASEKDEKEASLELTGLTLAVDRLAHAAAEIGGFELDDSAVSRLKRRLRVLAVLVADADSEIDAEERAILFAGGLVWVCLSVVNEALGEDFSTSTMLEKWSLQPEIGRALAEMQVPPERSSYLLAAIVCSVEMGWGVAMSVPPGAEDLATELLTSEPSRDALQVHSFQGVEYLNQEALETTLEWLCFLQQWSRQTVAPSTGDGATLLADWEEIAAQIAGAAGEVGYRTDRLLSRLSDVRDPTS